MQGQTDDGQRDNSGFTRPSVGQGFNNSLITKIKQWVYSHRFSKISHMQNILICIKKTTPFLGNTKNNDRNGANEPNTQIETLH